MAISFSSSLLTYTGNVFAGQSWNVCFWFRVPGVGLKLGERTIMHTYDSSSPTTKYVQVYVEGSSLKIREVNGLSAGSAAVSGISAKTWTFGQAEYTGGVLYVRLGTGSYDSDTWSGSGTHDTVWFGGKRIGIGTTDSFDGDLAEIGACYDRGTMASESIFNMDDVFDSAAKGFSFQYIPAIVDNVGSLGQHCRYWRLVNTEANELWCPYSGLSLTNNGCSADDDHPPIIRAA